MFVGDAPPPGSTLLKFEITVLSAVLCPQVGALGECLATPQLAPVTLFSFPGPEGIEIELTQLELESAFLNFTNVPAGSYAGARLTFGPTAELTLLLPDNTLPQQLSLPVNPTSVTPTFPGGLSVASDTNFGFLVDFDVFNSIQSSGNTVTGISPLVTLVKLPAGAGQMIEELEDVTGKVSNLNKTCPTGTFNLIESVTGITISNIRFDASTEFETEVGVPFNCTTLANDQTVEVDLELRPGPSLQSPAQFFAEDIEQVNGVGEKEVEGVVFQVELPTRFILLVQEEEGVPTAPPGSFLTVDLTVNTRFRVDADNLPIPANLLFTNGNHVLAGQKVEVDLGMSPVVGPPSGQTCATPGNCSAIADGVKLKRGTLTARVASVNAAAGTFTLDQLPSLFGSPTPRPLSADCNNCTVSSILVHTSSQTDFRDGLNGVGGLSPGNIVTVRGLLFKNGFMGPPPGSTAPNIPQLVARRVRRRT